MPFLSAVRANSPMHWSGSTNIAGNARPFDRLIIKGMGTQALRDAQAAMSGARPGSVASTNATPPAHRIFNRGVDEEGARRNVKTRENNRRPVSMEICVSLHHMVQDLRRMRSGDTQRQTRCGKDAIVRAPGLPRSQPMRPVRCRCLFPQAFLRPSLIWCRRRKWARPMPSAAATF
jgi:hypothetical protein